MKDPLISEEILYKAYSFDSKRIICFGANEQTCFTNSPPILPPAPVISITLSFMFESKGVLCTFCLRPSTSSIAIGFAVNFASASSEKFDSFGIMPIAKPFF